MKSSESRSHDPKLKLGKIKKRQPAKASLKKENTDTDLKLATEYYTNIYKVWNKLGLFLGKIVLFLTEPPPLKPGRVRYSIICLYSAIFIILLACRLDHRLLF